MARGGFYSVDSLRGVYVLLVDDDAENRAVVSAILRYCGALVRDVDSANEARVATRETTPGLVVVGVRPPANPTLALIRGLRSLQPEHGGKAPAVGVGPASLADTARLNGFDGYLEEPIDPWALCRLVSELSS
ncbi:MAG: hypothetical protein AUH29_14725 [Candidatus Rokubacteria bacterium 13_1_40CM_69_27]|nr:MAG: hypothetical protein AUH29_14725 [Candidatus Rokubacteria bacterium 13_1_40CM_69_27]